MRVFRPYNDRCHYIGFITLSLVTSYRLLITNMKKLIWVILILLVGILIYRSWNAKQGGRVEGEKTQASDVFKFALVADIEGNDRGLASALDQAKASGSQFVIALGDLTQFGSKEDLAAVKKVLDDSHLSYYAVPGDHDLPASRSDGKSATSYFKEVFGDNFREFKYDDTQFVLVDNSDIYTGIDDAQWFWLSNILKKNPPRLRLVFAHKTPYHPTSAEKVMGAEKPEVAAQAKQFLSLLEGSKVGGYFSGDTHYFASFPAPDNSFKITTVGAIVNDRNVQTPRFALVSVRSDGTFDVEDMPIEQ